MNMLKIDALVQCRSHWQWIYDNTERLMSKNLLITPEEIKLVYFEKNYTYSRPDAGCFCCEYDKKFLIIGHQNALKYKEIFPLIRDNKIWLGNGFKGGAAHFINKHYEDYATVIVHESSDNSAMVRL